MTEVRVTSDGCSDSTAVLLAAIDRAGHDGAVVLEAGTYRVAPSGGLAALEVIDAKGLTLEGNGATLVVTDPRSGGLWLRRAQGVTVRDLVVDFDPVPFTQGTVIGVRLADGTFDVDLDAGYLRPDHPAFVYDCDELHPSQFGAFYDAESRRLKEGHRDHVFVRSIDCLDGDVWRVTAFDEYAALRTRGFAIGSGSAIDEALTGVEPGDRFVFAARYSGTAVAMLQSDDVVLERVEVRAAASHAFLAQECGDVTLVDPRVAYAAGVDRLITTDGDGFHVKDCRGRPTMRGGQFEGMLDDGCNVHATPLVVREVVDERTVVLHGQAPVRVGDRLLFQSPTSGVVKGQPEVESVGRTDDGAAVVRLADAVPDLTAGPTHVVGDIASNVDASGSGYTFRDNLFREHRGIGMRPRAPHGVIEDNTVDGTGSHGLLVCNDPSWPEGPVPCDVTIRGNTFRNVGRTNRTAAVRVIGARLGDVPAAVPVISGVRIEDNRIEDVAGDGLYVGGCQDVTITGNVIERVGLLRPDSRRLVVEACADIHIEDVPPALNERGGA